MMHPRNCPGKSTQVKHRLQGKPKGVSLPAFFRKSSGHFWEFEFYNLSLNILAHTQVKQHVSAWMDGWMDGWTDG